MCALIKEEEGYKYEERRGIGLFSPKEKMGTIVD